MAGSSALAAVPVAEPARRGRPAGRHLRPVSRTPRARLQPAQTRLLLVLSGIVVLVAIAFALVYLHVIAAQRQFTLDRLDQQVTTQEQRYDRLREQVAQLDAPQRIISQAEGRFGMQEPASVTYLQAAGPTPRAGSPSPSTTQPAPAGDADWPAIKALLKGSP